MYEQDRFAPCDPWPWCDRRLDFIARDDPPAPPSTEVDLKALEETCRRARDAGHDRGTYKLCAEWFPELYPDRWACPPATSVPMPDPRCWEWCEGCVPEIGPLACRWWMAGCPDAGLPGRLPIGGPFWPFYDLRRPAAAPEPAPPPGFPGFWYQLPPPSQIFREMFPEGPQQTKEEAEAAQRASLCRHFRAMCGDRLPPESLWCQPNSYCEPEPEDEFGN